MNAKVLGIFLLLIILCGYMSVVSPESFLKGNNIENLLRRTALYGILGIGVAFVIITSGIDLSIGSVVCLSGCLLAIFLRVDYEPFDMRRVLAVRGDEQRIVLAGKVDEFAVGDQVRFYGGRRARNALCTVAGVEFTQFSPREGQPATPATSILVDKPLSGNDSHGRLAKTYAIEHSAAADVTTSPQQEPSVTIAGRHPDLRSRDRLTLFLDSGGEKQLEVVAAEVQGEQTKITVKDELGGGFSDQWSAIPVERRQRASVPTGVALVLLIGLGLGLTHGLLITKLELPPFVVTLCGLLIYRGISRWLVDDQTQGFSEYSESLSQLATGKLMLWGDAAGGGFGIPIPFFIFILIAVLAAVFLNMTIWGRYMQALGFNRDAAQYSGINTDRVTVLAYVICTMLAALGGMLFALDGNSVSPSSFGNFFELYAIAAAVLGGCSLRGGEGSILGVVIGTAVMRVLYNLIVLLHVSERLEFAIIGLVILAGVIADVLLKRVMVRRRAAAQARAAAD